MNRATRFVIFFVALIIALPAFSDDQQKAQKELTKLTAMATDFTGRRAVNIAISQQLNVPRAKLVEARGQTGLSYGSLFLAEELVKNGVTMDDIAAQLKTGKPIGDLANERHLDWKQVMADAKKANVAVDQNLSKYFGKPKETAAQDEKDQYDVHYDGVKADAEVSQNDISAAQDRYVRLKDQAAKAQGDRQGLSSGDERIAATDHVSDSGPSAGGSPGQGGGPAGGSAGTSAPAGMGGPH